MANSGRNRGSIKGSDNVSRTGSLEENRGNKKLAGNRSNNDERISTKGDESNPKYSKTNVRKEEKERRDSSDKSR
jgi:hypothetical protein